MVLRRQKEVRFPVMGSVAQIVEDWLRSDQKQPQKQRHTARRVYTRLLEEYEFGAAESTVRRWVRGVSAQPITRFLLNRSFDVQSAQNFSSYRESFIPISSVTGFKFEGMSFQRNPVVILFCLSPALNVFFSKIRHTQN